MKTGTAVVLIVIVAIVGISIYKWSKNEVGTNPPAGQTSSIEGCYVAGNGKDVFTLNIKDQSAGVASGSLSFKNFEKDSSSGTFAGTYGGGILLADYAFQSEGMNSVMQVIFKKAGDDFVRGYGDVDSTGTRFVDPNKVTYDTSSALSVFKKESCPI